MPFADKERAYAKARSIFESKTRQKIPVEVDRIAKKLKAVVRYEPFNNDVSGMALIKDGKDIIGVNALHDTNRQRFTIAHEIGHLMLHRHLIEEGIHMDLYRDAKASKGTDLVEIEANSFASELLMPTEPLKKELQALLDSNDSDAAEATIIDDLAKKFRVSSEAMQHRVARLSIEQGS
ncbi:MAG: ImmA/IrrE family metallo-endopeptidase [Candidatus Thiodiazotropha taylori]